MSPWLKPRLIALFCGAVFLGGATYLHAQYQYEPPAKTPEVAAQNFFKMLQLVQYPQSYARYEDNQKALLPLYGSIERSQYESLRPNDFAGLRTISERVDKLFAAPATANSVEANSQPLIGGQTVVSLMPPSTQPRTSEVVVVQEDGGYRVDVVATYARWNHLSRLDADKALFRETGWISPTLSTQREFLGGATLTSCQSNLKQLGLGIAMYTQDYDELMPPARKWASRDILLPYVKKEELFSCPALGKNGRGNGYAYNSKLNQVSIGRFYSTRTIELYETSNLNKNVSAPFTGRAYRHRKDGKEGMNICFMDGHVKWYARGKSEQLSVNLETAKTSVGFLTISGETP